MTYKKKCLFLGYDRKKTKLIDFLESSDIDVVQSNDHLSVSEVDLFDIVVSFGYAKLLNIKFLKKTKKTSHKFAYVFLAL